MKQLNHNTSSCTKMVDMPVSKIAALRSTNTQFHKSENLLLQFSYSAPKIKLMSPRSRHFAFMLLLAKKL